MASSSEKLRIEMNVIVDQWKVQTCGRFFVCSKGARGRKNTGAAQQLTPGNRGHGNSSYQELKILIVSIAPM